MTSPAQALQFPLVPIIPVDPGRDGRMHRHAREWRPSVEGLGQSTLSLAQFATQGAATTAGILASLSILPAVAGPIGAAVAGLVAIGSAIAGIFSGCGQTCIIASQDANKVGDFMAQNMETYLKAPVHYKSLQAAALNNFDFAWKALVQACGNPQLSTAGQNCIADRQQGACKWTASPGGWQQQNGQWIYVPWGPAGSGTACWNYFVGMRDPIANDPTVVPDPVPSSAGGTTSAGVTPSGTAFNFQELMPLALIAGAVILAMVIL